MLEWYWCLLIAVACLIVGAVAGLLIMRAIFNKQLKDNPPINRNMIRAMFMQMGRKPSEKDITRVLDSMGIKEPTPKKTKKENAKVSKNEK